MKKLVLTISMVFIVSCAAGSAENRAKDASTVPSISEIDVTETDAEVEPEQDSSVVVAADAGVDSAIVTDSSIADSSSKDSSVVITDASKDSSSADTGSKDAEVDSSEADSSVAAKACGDGVVDPTNEDCDGTDLNGETCVSLGYDYGTLGCYSFCRFSTIQCRHNTTVTPVCGNKIVEDGEECDGISHPTCTDLGFDGGTVTCRNCLMDTTLCVKNEEPETCDTDCGPNAVCSEGECKCAKGQYGQTWDNCDGDWSNGCETPTNRAYSCGSCGNIDACSVFEECNSVTRSCAPNATFTTCDTVNPAVSGCSADKAVEECVCLRYGHSTCCGSTGSWTEECAESAMTECAGTAGDGMACDVATGEKGCNDSVIEACVVAINALCANNWNAGCVTIARDNCDSVSSIYF